MPPKPVTIVCPKNPDHGIVAKRWLSVSEREYINSQNILDVFEIECPRCGKYEFPENNSPAAN